MSARPEFRDDGANPPPQPTPALRWPVLERLLDPLPDCLAARLAEAWGMTAVVSRDPGAAGRIVELGEAMPRHTLHAVVEAEDEDAEGLVCLDPVTIFAVLAFILGDRDARTPSPPPDRPCTPFEANVMRPLIGIALEAVETALRPAGNLRLSFKRWATPAEVADAPALGVKLALGFGEASGVLGLLLPLGMLKPLAGVFAGVFHGQAGRGVEWRPRLELAVMRAHVLVEAVLHRQAMPLSRLRALVPGDTLLFDAPVDPPVALLVEQTRVAEGRLGHAGGRIAVRLDSAPLARKDELP